jgi:AbrB family looped-hinge helix DNA binding protein
MSKVTSKLQVTVPKAIAQRYGIRPGDDIDWVPAGDDSIRVVLTGRRPRRDDLSLRLRLFDAATERQRRRQSSGTAVPGPRSRGWTREELYERGRTR